jgi:hypothetical protein
MAPRRSSRRLDESNLVSRDAIALAIEAARMPSRHRQLTSGKLPPGMFDVIKAAAGDAATLKPWGEAYGLTDADVQEAAKHFLLLRLSAPEVHGLRLLGLEEGATDAAIKDHKRWLLKWLHPDRNPNKWEQALFLKVNAALDAGVAQASTRPESAPHNSRRHSNRRKWIPSDRRAPQASPWKVTFRLLGPLLACVAFALVVVLVLSASQTKTGFDVFAWLAK